MDETTLKKRRVQQILTKARASLLLQAPFYGSILLRLKLGTAPCGTACTDMKRLLFDPEFVLRLEERPEELEFVMLHEALHCVLLHPVRGRGKIPLLYNLAADIVVNAEIMNMRWLEEYEVDGQQVAWRAPDGRSGHLCTAEEIYEMLLDKYRDRMEGGMNAAELSAALYSETDGAALDVHDIWQEMPAPFLSEQEWKRYIREAARIADRDQLPPLARRILDEVDYEASINWREALQDFLRRSFERFDYTFSPADRRFAETDFLLPAFWETASEETGKLWFMADASGSVDDRTLTAVVLEIRACLEQLAGVEGRLSFFDTEVTEPLELRTADDLKDAVPEGGGGTSFYCMFEYLKERAAADLPDAVIILTDGYAQWPPEEEAMGIPVLWVLVDSQEDAPWGRSLHMDFLEAENEC